MDERKVFAKEEEESCKRELKLKMSGNVNLGRHRRNVQMDRARSRSPRSSSSTIKKFRQNDENPSKELIHEITSDSHGRSTRKEKSTGSKELDNLYASYLPSSDYYERSYMHRDILSHLIVTSTDFLISASQDGHIKFWKILTPDYLKQRQIASSYQTNKSDEKESNSNLLINGPIEFVKHFRAHLGSFAFFFFEEILFHYFV